MPDHLPFVACLCPTYCRPQLLEQSIKMFEQQDYPEERRSLFILDDSPNASSTGWTNHTVRYSGCPKRYSKLPTKFNHLADWALDVGADVLVVWEDDDEYRPWHLSTHVKALQHGNFSKPSRVLSDYPGHIVEEGAAGRFHASMAFTSDLYRKVGGWVETRRADFDQQLIANLTREGSMVDTCDYGPPSYVFKWHTNDYHGQNTMEGPGDEEWYDKIPDLFRNRQAAAVR